MITKTSAEAQKDFDELLDAAQRDSVAITLQGRLVAYVISPRDMEELEAYWQAKRKNAVADLEEWRERAAKEISPEAAALTDEEIVRMVHEAREEIAREEAEKAVRSN